jgi:hypothetical protein
VSAGGVRRDLLVRIQLKDERGVVVGETDAISYKGLLSVAHDEGLSRIRTRLIQVPSAENKWTAIVRSKVKTRRGWFTGLGDASPESVNRSVALHTIRCAETRATARALRAAVNIGEVAVEELAGDVAIMTSAREPKPATSSTAANPSNGQAQAPADRDDSRPPQRFRGRDARPTEADPTERRAMSDEQRKLLFRLAFDGGATKETVRDRVLAALGVERLEWATRPDASRAIDLLKGELAKRASNGNGMNGHASA